MLGHVQDRIGHAQIRVITALLRQAVFDLGVLLLGNSMHFAPLTHTREYATKIG
jgi:hypothetical protein